MKRWILLGVVALVAITATQSETFGRGFGGFHGGGFGGFHGGGFGGGGFGGFHAGGFEGGGFHAGGYGGEAGGFHAGGFDAGGYHAGGYGGFHEGGFGGSAGFGGGADRAGSWGGSVNRGQLNSFLGMPTDCGMHATAGAYGSRGAVSGSEGAAAWRGGAAGHVYQGPMGTTIAHGTAGGRYVAGGSATAGRGYATAYGTHDWSPTYCHAQGLAAQRWCSGAGMFTPAWSGAHPWAWHPAAYTAADWGRAVWAVPTAAAVGAWLGSTAAYVPYDYGNNVTYQDNEVYYGAQPVATRQQYYQQALTIAGSGNGAAGPASPGASSRNPPWLPLGVFGLVAEGQKTPSMIFQLAVDKAGAIRGNYYDQVSDTTVPVTGAVDKRDQRVAWTAGNNQKLVIDTALYNLTQNASTALVHDGSGQTEQYVLVRMKQPEDSDQP